MTLTKVIHITINNNFTKDLDFQIPVNVKVKCDLLFQGSQAKPSQLFHIFHVVVILSLVMRKFQAYGGLEDFWHLKTTLGL